MNQVEASRGTFEARLAQTIWRRTAAGVMIAVLPLLVTGTLHLVHADKLYPSATIFVLFAALGSLNLVTAVPTERRTVHVMVRDATQWVHDGRPPAEDERSKLLSIPWRFARRTIPWWLPALLIWGSINTLLIDMPDGRAVLSTVGILLGSMVLCALSYLSTEEALRPLFALALGHEVSAIDRRAGLRTRLLVYWIAGSGSYLAGILAILLLFDERIHRVAGVVCCMLGAGVGFVMTTLAGSLGDRAAREGSGRDGAHRVGRSGRPRRRRRPRRHRPAPVRVQPHGERTT